MKLSLVFPNHADAAALSSSPAAIAALPVEHLQDQTRARIWRSNGVVEAQHILGNFATYASIGAVALVRHNLTTSATWRLRLYNNTGQGGALNYDSGTRNVGELILGWGEFAWGIGPWGAASAEDWPVPYFSHWFAPVPALSFDLQIDDPANPDGYLQAARLVVGESWSAEFNISYGHGLSWREATSQTRSDGGSLRSDPRAAYRRLSLDLECLSDIERRVLMDKLRRLGLRDDVFVSCFAGEGGADERDYAALVKLVEVPALTSRVHGLWAAPLVFEES